MKQFVIPAILPVSRMHLHECLQRIDGVAEYAQIDIVDGIFADTVSWPFSEGGDMRDVVRETDNFRISFEFDLMVQNPEEVLPVLLASNAKRYVVHISSTDRLRECIQKVAAAGREIYLGVGIEDTLSAVSEVLDSVDGVQCMGIVHIGRQGELYDERVERVVRSVLAMRPGVPVVVDGGVSSHSIPALVDAGVSQVAVGSALFTGDTGENFTVLTAAGQ